MRKRYLYTCPDCFNTEEFLLEPTLAEVVNILCPICLEENLFIKMKRYTSMVKHDLEESPEREKFKRKVKAKEWR